VLHNMFAMPFDEIAPSMGRTPTAARQLASRARRRVQVPGSAPDAVQDGKIVEIELLADPEQLSRLDLGTV